MTIVNADLGFVLIAVQESAFLPPPTQFDILYGFTDLKIMILMRRMLWLRGFCTCNRPVRCSSLCISPCGIFCLPADHDDYDNAVVDQRNDTNDKSYKVDADLLLALTTSPLALSWEFQNYKFNTFHHVLENSNGYFFITNFHQHHHKCQTRILIYPGIRNIKLIAWDQLPQVIISALSKVASSKPGSRVITKAMTRHDIRYDNQKW